MFPPFLASALQAASYPFRYWNWKSAALSGLIRSLVYFCVVVRHGREAGLHAALVEAVYVALTAGFYSAMQQGALRAQPRWVANTVVVAGVPLLAQTVDYLVQHAAATPNAKAASVGMAIWGLVSAAFHLHLMRNGAMLVGAGARSFRSDLKRMPWMVATFVAAPVVAAMARLRVAEEEPDIELAA